MWWLIFGLIAVFAALMSLKGWEWIRQRSERVAERAADVADDLEDQFRTAWADADDYVERANAVWPSLKHNGFFYIAICTSTILAILGVIGGASLSSIWLLQVLFACAFVLANVVQAGLAVAGDEGYSAWYQFNKKDRKGWQWAVLWFTLVVNIFGSITGSAAIGSWLTASNDVQVSSYAQTRDLKQSKIQQRDVLNARRMNNGGSSLESLQATATEKEAAAQREAARGGCGSKCERIKSEAIKYRALARDAERERELTEQIRKLDTDLQGMAASGQAKTSSSPHGELIEGVSGGTVSRAQVDTYGTSIFWLMWALADLALWLFAGDAAGKYRAREFAKRAERANATLTNQGLEPRYSVLTEQAALPAPEAKSGDNITIQVDDDPAAKIAASDQLTEIDRLFGEAVSAEPDGLVPFGKLHQVYRTIAENAGRTKWLNQTDFQAALKTYATLKKIKVQAGQIVGYKLAMTQAETSEAAE